MKDALGHGSDPRGGEAAHQAGVNKIGVSLAPRVLDVVRGSPGGFSVTPSGKEPSGGFMVSLPGHTSIVNESDLAGPHGKTILETYAQEHAHVLSQLGAHIGGWTDKESGKTYLDVSQNVSRRQHAVKLGKERNQIAIWDVKHSREVRTGGSGE